MLDFLSKCHTVERDAIGTCNSLPSLHSHPFSPSFAFPRYTKIAKFNMQQPTIQSSSFWFLTSLDRQYAGQINKLILVNERSPCYSAIVCNTAVLKLWSADPWGSARKRQGVGGTKIYNFYQLNKFAI
jgi:hypothetical protein